MTRAVNHPGVIYEHLLLSSPTPANMSQKISVEDVTEGPGRRKESRRGRGEGRAGEWRVPGEAGR